MKNEPTKKKYPRLEDRPLSTLKPHPDGVRTHDADSLYALGRSLSKFGLLRPPFVVNDATGNMIDGDLVLEALRSVMDKDAMVPVWAVSIPEEDEDAAHLALQNHAGEWQWQPVSELLKAVAARGGDVKLAGFHESDTGPLLAADWKPAAKGPLDGSDASQISLL